MHGNTDNNFCIYLIEAIGKYWYIFMKEKHNRKQSRRSDKDSVKEAQVREEEIKEAPVRELAPKDILQEKEKSSAAEQDAAEKEKPSAAEQKTAEKESQTEEKSEAAQEPDYYDDDTDYYDDDSRNGAEHHDVAETSSEDQDEDRYYDSDDADDDQDTDESLNDQENEEPDSSSGVKSGKRKKHGKKMNKKKLRVIFFVTELIVLLVVVAALFVVSKIEKVQKVDIPTEKINEKISESVKQNTQTGTMKGYVNIALFGVDTRKGELTKDTRSDTILIASINQDTGDIKLVSVYRDTYLNLGNDTYNKCNAAYAEGGPEQAINMLNMNLDMNIQDFVTVGFGGLSDVIDDMGGLDLNIDEAEIQYLNDYEKKMAQQQGKEYVPVTQAGWQHLDGLQATAYCRIRYTAGDDFKRAERQRTVLNAIFEKAKTATPAQLTAVADDVFDEVYTSMDLNEILGYLSKITSYKIADQGGFPQENMRSTGRVGRKGSCVIPDTLESNVVWLHHFLFEDYGYVVSDEVKEYSSQVESDTTQVKSATTYTPTNTTPAATSAATAASAVPAAGAGTALPGAAASTAVPGAAAGTAVPAAGASVPAATVPATTPAATAGVSTAAVVTPAPAVAASTP